MRSRLIVILLLSLIVAAAVWLASRDRQSEIRLARQADGSAVRIHQVSFGKSHPAIGGSIWHRLLGRMPTNIAYTLGVNLRTQSTVSDTLVVWINWRNRTNPPPHPLWLRILDSNGLATAIAQPRDSVSQTNGSGFTSFHITSIPRNQRSLAVELTAADNRKPNGRQLIASFAIKNPAFTKDKPAGPAHPASAQFDGERFTLLGIRTGLSTTGSLSELHPGDQWTELLFRIGTNEPAQRTRDAQIQGDWSIQTVELGDGFGNLVTERNPLGRVIPMGMQNMFRKDDGIALVRGAVWPGEFWNVRAEFQRNFTRSFDTSHCWSASVPVPSGREKISLHQTGRANGCVIELESIESDGKSPPIINVRFSPRDSKSMLGIIRVEDQRGNEIIRWNRGAVKNQRKWEMRTTPESRELKIKFAVANPVVVQLSAPAQIFRTNVAHWP